MTSTNKLALCIGMIISFLTVSIYAQSPGPEVNHFVGDGIFFDYPAEFSVKDETTPETHQFVVKREGSSPQLTIVIMRQMVLQKDLPAASETFREPLLKAVMLTLNEGNKPPERTSFQTQVGTKPAEGVRLRSSANKTGEVIWLRTSFHLVGFAFVRSDADEAVGAELWRTVSSSFRIKPPVVTGMASDAKPTENTKIEGGVLNGKALVLPPPAYPTIARAAHASGTVTVRVLIDEDGNVIGAAAMGGHPLLQAAAVAAARQARFSPTLLEGEPVRVTGVIQYKFVSRD